MLFSAYLGTLEFSLLFDQENNCLHCTIHKAKVHTISISSSYKQTCVCLCVHGCVILLEGPLKTILLLCFYVCKTSDCFFPTFLKCSPHTLSSLSIQEKNLSWRYEMLGNGAPLLWQTHLVRPSCKGTSLVLHVVYCHMMLIM